MSPWRGECLAKFMGSENVNRSSVAFGMGVPAPLAGMIAWQVAFQWAWIPMPTMPSVAALPGIGMTTGNDMHALCNVMVHLSR